ncbi:hypothetical protein [Flavobacterium sp.]|uniref:hypothetical protein n=1 Tax=Flavobacterium sp. TaxID=239 RepID=UPI0040344967
MITATIKKKIIALCGAHYSKKIIAYLTENGVLNEKGEPFSASSIQNIVGGRPHDIVEPHIIDFIAIKQKEIKALKVKRSKILKKR